MKYPLATPSWDQEEIDAIQDVVKTGFFSMGKNVSRIEDEFAKSMGSQFSIMVNSGSSANLIAIAALFYRKENPLRRGDEVLVPAVSWSTTYFPLYQYGLKLRFVDIDLETLNMDIGHLKKSISPKTRAIFAVNLLGNSNEYDEILKLCEEKNILLLEDNCESMGAQYGDKKLGTVGLLGTFSSYFSHHISTMEGGFVTTDDEELHHIMLSLRSHGWTRHLPVENHVTGRKSDIDFEESFKFVLPGYNLRPLEMSAAIGLKQLVKLHSFVEIRRKNATYFLEKMKKFEDYLYTQKEIGRSSWFGFSLICKKPEMRNALVQFLGESDIETRPIVAGNFMSNSVIRYFDYDCVDGVSNAQYLHDNGFFIGNYQECIEDKIDYFIERLGEFFSNKK